MVLLELHLLEGNHDRQGERNIEPRGDLDTAAAMEAEQAASRHEHVGPVPGDVEFTIDPVADDGQLASVGHVNREPVAQEMKQSLLDHPRRPARPA